MLPDRHQLFYAKVTRDGEILLIYHGDLVYTLNFTNYSLKNFRLVRVCSIIWWKIFHFKLFFFLAYCTKIKDRIVFGRYESIIQFVKKTAALTYRRKWPASGL